MEVEKNAENYEHFPKNPTGEIFRFEKGNHQNIMQKEQEWKLLLNISLEFLSRNPSEPH